MTFTFDKYHGTGNDFIILDNREGNFNQLTERDIRAMCHRHFGIGADGLLLYQNKDGFDFEMVYFNADGKTSTMCGNGGRCMVKYAFNSGLNKFTYNFLAPDGAHEAEIDNYQEIRLKMQDVESMEESSNHTVLNTGSPHYVQLADDLENKNVYHDGRAIRNNDTYKAKGINVNFVEPMENGGYFVRTFERGVEDETYACGTGVTAVALAMAKHNNQTGHIITPIKALGGNMQIRFDRDGEHFTNIYLEGPAVQVFKGEIEI
jgi:diaminopimelate epimerase